MKEAYVKLETAKLLKEKGFDWETHHYYDEIGRTWFEDSLCDWNHRTTPEVSCPTQQMACRWLREEHNIFVTVQPCEVGAGVMDYTYCIYRIHGDNYYFEPLAQGRITEAIDYEKTIEAGLEYVLKNLI